MIRRKPPLGRVGELAMRLAYRVRRHLLRSPFLVARERRFGLRFRFKTEDAIGRRIYQSGAYEEAVTDFLTEELELRRGDVIVDVGANIGWFSVFLDHVAPRDASIYAFEPEPLNFELLTENLERNEAGAVVPVRMALADRRGRRRLFLYPDKNRGRHSFLELPGAEGTVDVETTTLDRFWEERGLGDRTLRLLKIDVEGLELAVLEGAAGLLERCRTVVTEYAPVLIRRSGEKPGSLVEYLRGFGFRPHRPGERGIVPVDAREVRRLEEPVNLVWRR